MAINISWSIKFIVLRNLLFEKFIIQGRILFSWKLLSERVIACEEKLIYSEENIVWKKCPWKLIVQENFCLKKINVWRKLLFQGKYCTKQFAVQRKLLSLKTYYPEKISVREKYSPRKIIIPSKLPSWEKYCIKKFITLENCSPRKILFPES